MKMAILQAAVHMFNTVKREEGYLDCWNGLRETSHCGCLFLGENALQKSAPIPEKWEEVFLVKKCTEPLSHRRITDCLGLNRYGRS